jgi:hypothetical protein
LTAAENAGTRSALWTLTAGSRTPSWPKKASSSSRVAFWVIWTERAFQAARG